MTETRSRAGVEQADSAGLDDKSLGELVAAASRDASHLVRAEIALARAELLADVKKGGVGGGLLGAAGFFGYMALLLLSVAGAFAIALVLPLWAGFAIVGGAYLLLATILGGTGGFLLGRLNKARRTKETVKADLAMIRRDNAHGTGPQGTRPRD
jgi:hypothetical protein